MIGIVDYGVGNIFSLKCSLDYLGIEGELIGDPRRILSSERVILPGVGSFGDAMDMLNKTGMDDAVKEIAAKGTPLLGICLGMQVLFDEGKEYGDKKGLGLIPGIIRHMKEDIKDENLVFPQMGWNELKYPSNKEISPLFKYVPEGSYVYFVHSYSAITPDENVIAKTDYGFGVTAAVAKGNVMGTQFHPEKSGEVGLNILKAFCEL